MKAEWITTLINAAILCSSLIYLRRGRKAEVRVKEEEAEKAEISNADAMVDLVKKANEMVVNTLKEENEKFRRSIAKLEKAIRNINRCPHRDSCPALDGMQVHDTTPGNSLHNEDGQHRDSIGYTRHDSSNRER